jgi:hypothetical protein
MGRILIASCSCGYQSKPIYHGTGMSGGEPNNDSHFVCLACGVVFAADLFSSRLPDCTECGSADVQPTMRMVEGETEPIAGPFPCPQCKRWMMAISEGLWD